MNLVEIKIDTSHGNSTSLLKGIKCIDLKDFIWRFVITPTDKIGTNIPFISQIYLFFYHLIRNLLISYISSNFTVAFLNPKKLSTNIFWMKDLSLNLKMVRSKIYINVDLKQNESVLLKLLSILSNLGRKQYNQRLFELCKNFVKDEFQIFI